MVRISSNSVAVTDFMENQEININELSDDELRQAVREMGILLGSLPDYVEMEIARVLAHREHAVAFRHNESGKVMAYSKMTASLSGIVSPLDYGDGRLS